MQLLIAALSVAEEDLDMTPTKQTQA